MSRMKAWRIIKGCEPEYLNPHIVRGLALEETARRHYCHKHNTDVEPCGFVVHPEHYWLGASPDGLVPQKSALMGPGMLEVKCPEKMVEYISMAHQTQIMVQMACLGRAWCDYFAYLGDGVYFEKRIFRDLYKEQILIFLLKEFYEDYVLADIEPPRLKRRPTEEPWNRQVTLISEGTNEA